MMCNEWETQLNEYVDGTLAAEARALVEAHLAGCAGCREAVVELRALVAGAADLPKRIEPARDLWTGIAARVGKREVRNGKRWWRTALAAAATLVIGFAVYRLLPPFAAHYRLAGEGWVAVAAQYEQASDEQMDRLVKVFSGQLGGPMGASLPSSARSWESSEPRSR